MYVKQHAKSLPKIDHSKIVQIRNYGLTVKNFDLISGKKKLVLNEDNKAKFKFLKKFCKKLDENVNFEF